MTKRRLFLAAIPVVGAFLLSPMIDSQLATASTSEQKDKTMKYLLLIYGNEANGIQPNSPEFGPYMAAYGMATETFTKDGAYVTGEALLPTATATSVRVRNGKLQSMDGPFAETKEQLGGFYVLNCKNLDEAIRYAAMIPDAATGTVEIRPVLELGGSN